MTAAYSEGNGVIDSGNEPSVVAHYMRYYEPYTEKFDTVNEAFRFLASGEDSGNLASVRVIDGDIVYERDTPEFDRRLWEAEKGLV